MEPTPDVEDGGVTGEPRLAEPEMEPTPDRIVPMIFAVP